jgi:glutamate N-acetyltransferase/amino-acid N-acetyltransferase
MFALPKGYSFAGVACGVKPGTTKLDLSMIVSDRPASAAGVYTQNLVFAAPVALDRSRTPSDGIRVVVTNSGNANACTGERGLADAHEMARLAASAVGAPADAALVMSTGVIGWFLPIDRIAQGIHAAQSQFAEGEAAFMQAATAIMTTDTVPKVAGKALTLSGKSINVVGMAKGAAMIGPNMATMLGVVFSDAAVSAADLQRILSAAVERTFNCISVEGHTSTNDTVLLLANGAAGGEQLTGEDLATFQAAVQDVCGQLAKAIPSDGEGTTHLVTIDVLGCANFAAARTIAKAVAESALVKCAIAGGDPNWGRIVSAAGYAGVPFDPHKVDLAVNGHLLYKQGAPVAFDAAVVSVSIKSQRDTEIVLTFGEGTAECRFWTTDLTAEYVHLNADYTT